MLVAYGCINWELPSRTARSVSGRFKAFPGIISQSESSAKSPISVQCTISCASKDWTTKVSRGAVQGLSDTDRLTEIYHGAIDD